MSTNEAFLIALRRSALLRNRAARRHVLRREAWVAQARKIPAPVTVSGELLSWLSRMNVSQNTHSAFADFLHVAELTLNDFLDQTRKPLDT
jgi:hypothetical protein